MTKAHKVGTCPDAVPVMKDMVEASGIDGKIWMLYADANAEESTVEKVPAGTVFKRYRVPINAEYKYVEGILEDGRVMRVVEEYWFSEPTAYQAIMDKDGEQFSYSVKQ